MHVALLVINVGAKRLGEREKYHIGRRGLNLCQGGPGVDPGHRGREINPPKEESQGAPHPGGYPLQPAQDGPKGSGFPSGKTPLHAPCRARDSGPPLPHSARAE